MIGDTVWINRAHPGYSKANGFGAGRYHKAVCIAWALASILGDSAARLKFVSRFLDEWGRSPTD